LRIGIINIMPRAEEYEPLLLRPLSRWPGPLEVCFIRLESHGYSSSDRDHIARDYRTFGQVLAEGPLDGLILTGAPVEELAFHQVTYWTELTRILTHARRSLASTLGLCWGGMAVARLLGIDKQPLPAKLFGVFESQNLVPGEGLLAGADDRFWCAQSRHSGLADAELERARDAGLVRLLAHGGETGYGIFETPDHRLVAHLGHPEYEPARLLEEWKRDSALGRTDVGPPRNVDLSAPVNTWRSHSTGFFSRWLSLLLEARAAGVTGEERRQPGDRQPWQEEDRDEPSSARRARGQ
jgi:homoserine O-succinyltransferase